MSETSPNTGHNAPAPSSSAMNLKRAGRPRKSSARPIRADSVPVGVHRRLLHDCRLHLRAGARPDSTACAAKNAVTPADGYPSELQYEVPPICQVHQSSVLCITCSTPRAPVRKELTVLGLFQRILPDTSMTTDVPTQDRLRGRSARGSRENLTGCSQNAVVTRAAHNKITAPRVGPGGGSSSLSRLSCGPPSSPNPPCTRAIEEFNSPSGSALQDPSSTRHRTLNPGEQHPGLSLSDPTSIGCPWQGVGTATQAQRYTDETFFLVSPRRDLCHGHMPRSLGLMTRLPAHCGIQTHPSRLSH